MCQGVNGFIEREVNSRLLQMLNLFSDIEDLVMEEGYELPNHSKDDLQELSNRINNILNTEIKG